MSKGQKLRDRMIAASQSDLQLSALQLASNSELADLVTVCERTQADEFLGLAMVEITRRFMAKRSKRKKS
jgi:hypothetical protein